ncbi:DUF2855 family protein [Sandarakinorhabdus sp.]|uniref:DUF2855 family protein n=1 Tax=Sandarakinorhabdus sp. TaxID=1916663 RepID=UPI00286E1C1B|nr:DUF2855 family protein [Sandarakinorhabdus sp.]
MATLTELTVARADISEIAAHIHDRDLAPGEVLLAVERFALTANNVTYAAHGVDFAYWQFWPAPEGRGIVPVWGFARAVESHAEDIGVGERFYGYWPMASHAVLLPGPVSRRGFDDMASHRQGLAAVYNRYVPASAEWGAETIQCLFRPLYATSFVLDAMLSASPADVLLLTSASSKTALGLAQAARGRQRIVGLTSAANRAFCVATGYYDDVLDYDSIDEVAGMAVSLVDFSGNGAVRHAVHSHLGERLIESHVVGDTHWQSEKGQPLPGVRPQPFFAPTIIADRVKEWGAQGYDARLLGAWQRFAATLSWLHVEEMRGPAAAARAWKSMAAGRIDPAMGLVISI